MRKILLKIYLRNFLTIDYYLLIDVDRRNSNEQNIVNLFKRYCK